MNSAFFLKICQTYNSKLTLNLRNERELGSKAPFTPNHHVTAWGKISRCRKTPNGNCRGMCHAHNLIANADYKVSP
jgi:hypothetical protein